MQENDKAVIVYSTFPSVETAAAEANLLVEGGLAACVNILPGMVSVYVWKGETQRDAEVVLIAKTRQSLAGRLIAEARSRHPYENPAFVILPIEGGSADYLSWLFDQTQAAAALRGA